MKFKSIMTAICVLATANLAVAAPFAYVANSGTKNVSVIDTADNTIKATVSLPDILPTIHPYAYGVTVGASGQYIYVGLQDTNMVVVIDAAIAIIDPANAIVKQIGLGTDSPGGLAVNAAETRLYVASSKSNTLIVIDITGSDASEVARLTVEDPSISNPDGVVLSPAGDKAYVANSATGKIAEISLDEANNVYTRTALITVGGTPTGLAISSTGSKLYAGNLAGSAVAVIDTATKGVTQLRSGTDATVGSGTVSVALRADDTKAYAPSNSLDKLYVIDGGTNIVSDTQYTIAAGPFGSSVAPNNKLYVAMNLSDTVQVFNTADNTLQPTPIALPAGPLGEKAKPTSFGDFTGPDLPFTITSAAQPGCTIYPLGAVQVNDKGRAFTITETSNHCKVMTGCNTTDFSGGTSQEFPSTYAFTNVAANGTICALNISGTYYTLTTDWISSVSGSLYTAPAGINQTGNSTSKSADFLGSPTPTVVTIKAPTGYVAKNWTGACALTTGGTCYVTMDSNKVVGAVVELAPTGTGPIWNITKGTYHQTLAEATGAASSNDIIKITSTYVSGGSTAGSATQITLSGNWSADYSIQSGSVSMGALIITSVGVIADKLTI